MKATDKKKKTERSIFAELLLGIIGLFLGDITSKTGWALLFFLMGILILICPIIDNGIALKKSVLQYSIGSALIILSICLIFSWVRKKRTR